MLHVTTNDILFKNKNNQLYRTHTLVVTWFIQYHLNKVIDICIPLAGNNVTAFLLKAKSMMSRRPHE